MFSFDSYEKLFLSATKPSRYVGGELNSVVKEWSDEKLKFCLAFPEPYELGMSHLGYQILYHLLNGRDEIICERSFLPWVDMIEILTKNKVPLFSLESRKPLSSFDIVGFSLQYELSFTNVLSFLKLSGLPLLASERGTEHPIVVGGGPCAFNPEPLAPFFDLFIIGEAEEAIFELSGEILKWKNSKKRNKEELLNRLSKIEGVYVPSLFDEEATEGNGTVVPRPKNPDYTTVKRRLLSKLDINLLPKAPIVPYMQVTHDRVSIEVQRGCTKGCRFCHAGMIYRPTRQRSASEIIEYALRAQANTGYEEVSFLSLNSSDHPSLPRIFSTLAPVFNGKAVSLTLPSTRIDTFNKEVMKDILSFRKTGFTFAPEAGTERLRRAINKPIKDDEILENLRTIFSSGWNLVKLYFMIGLPTETDDDIMGISRLCNSIARMARGISGRNRINVNISPFVPKPHTPYQWMGQDSLQTLERKIAMLKDSINSKGIALKWHDPKMSVIEALIARGDRRIAKLLSTLHDGAVAFDSWSDFFNYGLWNEKARDLGIDIEKTVTEGFEHSSALPWNFIDTGINKDFLLTELEKTLTGEPTGDCAFSDCNLCGLCDESIKPVVDSITAPLPGKSTKPHLPMNYLPCVVRFSKKSFARLLSHLETLKVFERCLRRCGLNVKTSQGFHPIPIMKFSRALPIGLESEAELLLIHVEARQKTANLKEAFNFSLPKGFSVNEIAFPPENLIKRMFNPPSSFFKVNLAESGIPQENASLRVEGFKKSESFVINKVTKKGGREVNLKDIILELRLNDGFLFMTLSEGDLLVNPIDAVAKILDLDAEAVSGLKITKLKI